MNNGCATTPRVRAVRGISAVVLAVMAFTVGNVWLAIFFGLFSLSLTVGAVTGRCPNEFFPSRRTAQPEEIMGYPVAIQNLHGSKVKR